MKRTGLPDFSAVKEKRLLAALSGGADSVALLHMLHEQRDKLKLTLCAVHVDHCIRGEESAADAQYCRELCARLNIPFSLCIVDVPAVCRSTGEGMETAARRLRYEEIRRIKSETDSDYIALAHHLNDQAETVLMHLMRGCGPEGACGMAEFSEDLYRPLLNTPKSALEEWLRARNIPWREDRTNFDPFTPRNALRLHVLPAIEESYPRASEAIARYAEAAQCENRFMDRQTDAFIAGRLERGPYGTRLLRPDQADEAILRRAIRRICPCTLSHDRLTELTALCRKHRGKMEISGQFIAERTQDAIYFLPKRTDLPDPVPLPEKGTLNFGNLGMFSIRPSEKIPVRDNPGRQVLDADALAGAVIRTRRDGDRFRPLGSGDRLLSDYLTDKKIDRPLRDFIPLLAAGNRILWVVGVGISEEAKLRPDTRYAAQIDWKPNAITPEK